MPATRRCEPRSWAAEHVEEGRGRFGEANSALWRIVMVRLRWNHPEPRAYVDRCVADGKTRLEAIRCLKRFLARRIWRLLTQSTRPMTST